MAPGSLDEKYYLGIMVVEWLNRKDNASTAGHCVLPFECWAAPHVNHLIALQFASECELADANHLSYFTGAFGNSS